MVEQKVVNYASEGRPYAVLFWLGVTLADHTAEGDLVQLARNGALHFFLFLVPYKKLERTERYSSRSRLSNGSLDGGCRNLVCFS